jgi:acetylornithine deacetylase/succinyl-diaminopimelate desuccinylase family protein
LFEGEADLIEELISRLDDGYTCRILAEMIRINSVVGREGDLARYLQQELDALGLPCELHEVEPGRPNVYARLQGVGPGRRLNFNAHTDTVPVCEGWDTDPFTPVMKDGRIYGLGACDMKAGMACILTMLKAFVESGYPLRGELSFSGVVDEEAYSIGARAMLTTDLAGCDAIVLAEPYFGDSIKAIPLGITGKVLYDLTVKGHAAHGFNPHLGINAVEEAARILTSLDRLRMHDHPDFGRGNYCTLKIEGGYTVYSVVVPDRCRVEINRLLVPGETTETALRDMEELVRSLDLKAEVEVRLKPPQYEPFVLDRNEPILALFHQVYQEVMGVEPVYAYSPGITDANVFAGEGGIPCLHLGPPRGNVHQPNEYVAIDSLAPLARMYALIAARFLDGGNGQFGWISPDG